MIFKFKQFQVKQSDSAMKIGTDAVLLGSSTPISRKENRIFDIGSGTGVLSLMLAQRAPIAQINAIEIDEDAAEECKYNFQNSPFAERLSCIHSSLHDFLQTPPQILADIVISNPPFFLGSQAEGNRKKARDSYSLPAEELMNAVNQLLAAKGQFSLIIPHSDEARIIAIAKLHKLYPFEILRIRGRKDSKIIRSIMHFRKEQQSLLTKEIYIEVEKRHEYSQEYLELVKDFLL